MSPSLPAALPLQESPWLLALICLLIGAIGFWSGIRVARWVLRHRIGRSRKVGRRGDARARRILERAGYRLLETQVTAAGQVSVDEVIIPYTVRADALVRRKGRLFAAEFKGSRTTANALHPPTRRQLLEYACLFDVDGVLLVDAAERSIQEVRFPVLD